MDTREKLDAMQDALLENEVIRLTKEGLPVAEIASTLCPMGMETEGHLLQLAGAIREILRKAALYDRL